MKTARKPVFVLLFVVSLLLNGCFLLRSFPIRMGGGTYKPSPDNVFIAHAKSYVNKNPLADNHNIVGGDLEIRKFHDRMGDDIVISVIVSPPGIDNEMGYRMLDDPISWSPDSATATFDLPHAEIAITPKTTQPNVTDNRG